MTFLNQPLKSQADLVNSDSYVFKNTPAPFEGWLVDDRVYRYYRAQDRKAEELDQQINNVLVVNDPNVSIANKALYIGIGIVLGGATMYLANQKK
jgi:hypothetical protein